MLEYLHIENIAVAKKVDFSFTDGLNVLTGETGAGKSIIIDSINMILGAKMSKDIIRHGESQAVVSAIFTNITNDIYELCNDFDIFYDNDDNISISRIYTKDGKNSIKINSRPATLTQLRALGAKLLNIHGQNESQIFLNKFNHLMLLDEYTQEKNIFNKYQSLYEELCKIKSKISEMQENLMQKEMMSDILKYQIKEISSANFKEIDEEEKLLDLKKKLKSAEFLSKQISIVYRALFKSESGVSAAVLIEKAIDALYKLSEFEPATLEYAQKLKEINYEIEDIAEKSKDISGIDGIDDPKTHIDYVEERLQLINKLEKKYGATIKDILRYKEEAEEKLKNFENTEDILEEEKHNYALKYQKSCEIAEVMYNIRIKAANELSKIVNDSLIFLDMPKVQFKIDVLRNVENGRLHLNQYGSDDVEFLISTNPGENLKPMSLIASGGELSRIMLAIKSALANKIAAKTVIFDEIDAGVSGSTAQKIGVKLSLISRNSQVICVTHSAQISAFADTHLLIKKSEINERAETSVSMLNETERIEELARIIGGTNLIEIQYEAAKELISESKRLLEE